MNIQNTSQYILYTKKLHLSYEKAALALNTFYFTFFFSKTKNDSEKLFEYTWKHPRNYKRKRVENVRVDSTLINKHVLSAGFEQWFARKQLQSCINWSKRKRLIKSATTTWTFWSNQLGVDIILAISTFRVLEFVFESFVIELTFICYSYFLNFKAIWRF